MIRVDKSSVSQTQPSMGLLLCSHKHTGREVGKPASQEAEQTNRERDLGAKDPARAARNIFECPCQPNTQKHTICVPMQRSNAMFQCNARSETEQLPKHEPRSEHEARVRHIVGTAITSLRGRGGQGLAPASWAAAPTQAQRSPRLRSADRRGTRACSRP